MLCIYDEFSRLQFLSLPRIRWWRFSLALSWGYLSDFMQSGFSSSSTRSWITKVAGEALLVKTPRAPTSVIGKSQIKYLTGISALSRTGFKSLSQISNPYFSSNPNSFTVKSQIKSQIFRTVTVLTVSVVQLVRCSCGIKSHPKQKCFFSRWFMHSVLRWKASSWFVAIEIFSKPNRRKFPSNLKSNHDLLNRIFAVQIESENMFKSQFKSHHWPICITCLSGSHADEQTANLGIQTLSRLKADDIRPHRCNNTPLQYGHATEE